MRRQTKILNDIKAIKENYPKRADLLINKLNSYANIKSNELYAIGDSALSGFVIKQVKNEFNIIKQKSKLSAVSLLIIELFNINNP